MATTEQKETLHKRLKFTPKTVTLSLWGYGGEIAMGRLTQEQYDFWKDKEEADVIYHCTSWGDDEEFEEECGYTVPEEAKFCTDGSWYDTPGHLDNMSGVEFSDHCSIGVVDEDGNEIFDERLGWGLEEHGVNIDSDENFASNFDGVNHYFCFQSTEKGTFFSGDIHLTEPFDPKKLLITTIDFEGWELVANVQYDGEEVDGFDGYDTTGKGYYASINKV